MSSDKDETEISIRVVLFTFLCFIMGSDFHLLFWNSQGCGRPCFHRMVHEYHEEFRLDFVTLLKLELVVWGLTMWLPNSDLISLFGWRQLGLLVAFGCCRRKVRVSKFSMFIPNLSMCKFGMRDVVNLFFAWLFMQVLIVIQRDVCGNNWNFLLLI